MKERSHQAQIAILQKRIQMLEQKSSANAAESLSKDKKQRSSKIKAETKRVEDVNKNTNKSRFEDPQVPVLEQALEELLSSSKDYSNSEVEEFYTRLGCDSESVQVSVAINDYWLICD